MTVAVLLPTLNEAESLEGMIKRIRAVDSGYEIYVVDSGSVDGTIEIARKLQVRLIVLKKKGKGIAIKKAFREIEEDQAVLLDSDASYAPEEIPRLLKALGNCDVVLGSRFKGRIEKGAMKSINRIGNQLLTMIANLLYGRGVSDVCSGFWAFSKEAYKRMDINARHFSLEANFFVECAKKDLVLSEVPISYSVREGESKLTVFHGIEIGLYLIGKKFR